MNRNRTSLRATTTWFALALLTTGMLLGTPRPAEAQLYTPTGVADPNQPISFGFRDAPVEDVLQFLADASGKTIVKHPSVILTVSMTRQNTSVADAFHLLSLLLVTRGYGMVEREGVIEIGGLSDLRFLRSAPAIVIEQDLNVIPRGRWLIQGVFPLRFVDAQRVRGDLNQLFAQRSGYIIQNRETNTITIYDVADNIRSMAEHIREIDHDQREQFTTEVLILRYAEARAVQQILDPLFRRAAQDRRPSAERGGGGQQQQQPEADDIRGEVNITSDPRRNALVVRASPGNVEVVRRLVDELDVDVLPDSEFRIVSLQFADAVGLAQHVNHLIQAANVGAQQGGRGGRGAAGSWQAQQVQISISPDVRTNSIIIIGPLQSGRGGDRQVRQIGGLAQGQTGGPLDTARAVEELIRTLDSPSQVQDIVRTFELQHAVASEVALSMRNLFLSAQQGGQAGGFALLGQQQALAGSPLDLLRQVTVIPHDQTNQLLVTGPQQTFPLVESLLEAMDRRLPQVFIEVIIADISLDARTEFGIQWNAITGTSFGGTDFGLQDTGAGLNALRYNVLSRNFRAVLRALQAESKVRILSTPHVMVTDNSPAVISIGERVPFAEGSSVTAGGVVQTSVGFLDVAITLNVTPHISPGDQVLMDVDQAIDSVLEFIAIGPGQLAPRTTSRHAGTTVTVDNGQTIVIGGIISDTTSKVERKVPILGDIPILGQLFRSTETREGRNELVVFLTPHIVREPEQADVILDFERGRMGTDPFELDLIRPLRGLGRSADPPPPGPAGIPPTIVPPIIPPIIPPNSGGGTG